MTPRSQLNCLAHGCTCINTICYDAIAMHGQVGRSLLRHFMVLWERKVRTLKGSEPANSGAFEDLRS